MTYPFIAIGLIIVFVAYVLYLLIIKKDLKKLKIVLYPGLFFIAIWVVIYYFLLK
jgi:FtsH-binding integral membrane protein